MARQLFIDSRDRISGTTTNFSIQLNQTLTVESGKQYRIDNMRIPMVIPRIQAGVNDQLWFTLQNHPLSVTLVEGTYSGVDMAAMINQVLHDTHPEGPNPEDTAVDAVWKCSYNNHTAALSIGNYSDATFHILNDTEIKLYPFATASFASELFQNTFTTAPISKPPPSTAVGVSYTFSYASMVANDLIYLSSGKLASQDTFGPGGANDTIMAAVTTTDFASVMNQSMPYDVWLPLPVMTTQTLDFQLRSRAYAILQRLPNWSMVLTIR